MNNRQKAKHFKALYERALNSKLSQITVYDSRDLNHYKAECIVYGRDIYNTEPEFIKHVVTQRLINKLEPILSECIESEKDPVYGTNKCTIDIWVKGDGGTL